MIKYVLFITRNIMTIDSQSKTKIDFKYQIIIMRASIPKSLIIVIFIIMASGFNPCSVIQFSDYSYDLSGLRNSTITFPDHINYVKITPCYITACDDTPTSQKSFAIKGGNNTCQPLTINATIFENFNYINPQSPKDGISISYLPYITSFNDQNGVTQTKNSIQYNIYCSTTTSVEETCKFNSIAPNTTTLQDGTTFTINQNSIICQTSQTNGCPYLTINHFWQFLSDNSIWFAIVLWIFSIFELFMGYFVIRLTIFLYGILSGAVFGVIFSAQNYANFFYDDTSNGTIIFIILLSCLMGVLFGFSLLTLPRIGYVNIGMWDAIIFSLLLQNSCLYLSGSMTGFYITLGISCLIMFAISLLRFRKFIILSTPFISAFWLIRTLGFVLPYYPNEFASEKLFAINASTPWQFFLYLASIIILSILGCTFQFCWYKKKGRDHGNRGYYLEDDDNIKDKLKKFLQFNDLKSFINAGKEEMMFLKKLVVDRQSDEPYQSQVKKEKTPEIQMVKMSRLKQDKEKEKQKNNSNDRKGKINNQSQIDYNKKLKKVDSSDSDGVEQEKPPKNGSNIKISSGKGIGRRDNRDKKSDGSGNSQKRQQVSSDEQQQIRKVQVRGKKNKR